MTAALGGLLSVLAAFCYALSSVAIAKSAQSAEGRGNDVFLSIVLTALASGLMWLVFGPSLAGYERTALIGVAYFAGAGILANIIGRLSLFRSVELTGAIETGLIRRLIPVFAAILAVFVLGEVITAPVAIAFVLITAGVVIMMANSLRRARLVNEIAQRTVEEKRNGRALAVTSALSYGGSFVARKLAMQTLPDPLAGVFIGAVTGLLWFGGSGMLRRRNRLRLHTLLHRPSGWQFLAASVMTMGQIMQFMALKLASVTTVAIISSTEMFFAAWLAAHVFKTEKPPGVRFYIAAALAAGGVILLALAPAG
jgi:drug/metabolite transporter (DMT)-like permease